MLVHQIFRTIDGHLISLITVSDTPRLIVTEEQKSQHKEALPFPRINAHRRLPQVLWPWLQCSTSSRRRTTTNTLTLWALNARRKMSPDEPTEETIRTDTLFFDAKRRWNSWCCVWGTGWQRPQHQRLNSGSWLKRLVLFWTPPRRILPWWCVFSCHTCSHPSSREWVIKQLTPTTVVWSDIRTTGKIMSLEDRRQCDTKTVAYLLGKLSRLS